MSGFAVKPYLNYGHFISGLYSWSVLFIFVDFMFTAADVGL